MTPPVGDSKVSTTPWHNPSFRGGHVGYPTPQGPPRVTLAVSRTPTPGTPRVARNPVEAPSEPPVNPRWTIGLGDPHPPTPLSLSLSSCA
eukprot:753098-Hanusia_phi.AAC.4